MCRATADQAGNSDSMHAGRLHQGLVVLLHQIDCNQPLLPARPPGWLPQSQR